ncbi:hypothetical protein BDA99DRAFT_542859 [Phascolomyces articulosus]|uniref:Uncharacterized protein n=1 Tax=Phascolomyces articulosus TaxID=60185 RepID=A0AAD5P8C1_9FUNG|nr:hypothetical protein BDA99DRAFT_542859 [Phascolomyces articulosus]
MFWTNSPCNTLNWSLYEVRSPQGFGVYTREIFNKYEQWSKRNPIDCHGFQIKFGHDQRKTVSHFINNTSKRSKGQETIPFSNETFDTNDSCESYSFNLELVQNVVKESRFPEAVDLCDSTMNSILNQLLKILDIRAASLGMIADFKKTESDAPMMIQLAPTHSIGYVCMGDYLLKETLTGIVIYFYNNFMKQRKKIMNDLVSLQIFAMMFSALFCWNAPKLSALYFLTWCDKISACSSVGEHFYLGKLFLC